MPVSTAFAQKITPIATAYLLAITLFSLPLSSTAKSICLILSIISILLTPNYRHNIRQILYKPYCIAIFALFFLTIIACFWSPASIKEKLLVIEKYSKLLYLPILVVGFQKEKTRIISINAFLLAMLITSVLSTLKYHGFLQFINFNPDNVFRNHIMTGFMVAFATYLSALYFYRDTGLKRVFYGVLTIIFTYHVLFINGGRTGYILYLILMLVLLIQLCSLRQIILGILIITSIFITSYFTSNMMQTRVNAIAQQIHDYKHNKKDTDLGFRLQFHNYAYQLFLRHPIIGNGTASFTHIFTKENPIPTWQGRLLEPHSQYWLIAAEFGLIGIFALIFLFYTFIRESFKLKQMKYIAIAMLLPFAIGNISDSLLFYSGSGYFFILFMALCFGED